MDAHLSQEPRHQITKNDSIVGLGVAGGGRDARLCPEISLPLIQPPIACADVDEEYSRGTLDKPPSVHDFDTSFLHRSYGVFQVTFGRLELFDLDRCLISISPRPSATAVRDPTEALLRGPMRVYRSPYSRVVTGALDLRTE